MDTRPIVQSFFGKPVRVFRATFDVEMRGRNNPSSGRMGSRYGTSSRSKFTIGGGNVITGRGEPRKKRAM
jgi:hypothetical protein